MSVELLHKLGVYIDTEFLSQDLCADLCREIDTGTKSDTLVYREKTNVEELSQQIRKSYYAEIPDDMQREVAGKVKALQPILEEHFSESYHPERYEAPKFVLYEEGHFFGLHRDGQLNRKINMTIYLNDENSDHTGGGYSGGSLILYELFKNPALKNKGVTLTGQRGMLVAYPAEIVHEITPVISGKRYAAVARFLGKNG